ncbi:MAG: serine hydrolase domain-containing protein [Thermoanaerobaculia bacterium]|nr:serine hydrolase domain-containing protein [Thermoanaerobaculia bacterium]
MQPWRDFRPRRTRSLALGLAVVLVAGGAATAADFERTRAAIDDAIAGGTVSVSVAYARGGEIVWQHSRGWADRERRIEATPHTMYSLASISKPITATGLMILVERGLVDLDAPVNTYLGAAQLRARVGDVAEATVRRVANHTSGLPLHYQFFYRDEGRPVPSRDETILRYGNLVTAPGERFQYSNLGYGVLDHVLARVSGRAYEDFMREEVFLPLGLGRCAIGVPEELRGHEAQRYGGDGRPIPFYDFDHPGASAVYCSAHDLLRFGMFHLGAELSDAREILSVESRLAMREPSSTGNDRGYGVAWGVQKIGSITSVGHSGGMGGVATVLSLVPEEDAVFVVLLNSRGPLGEILDVFRHEALPEHFEAPSEPEPPPEPTPFAVGEELVGHWSGIVDTYAGEVPFSLRIRESGEIHARLGEQLWALVNDPSRADDGLLRGRFVGELPTEDVARDPGTLMLQLALRGDELDGALTAFTRGDRNKVGNALTHWVVLRRAGDDGRRSRSVGGS